MPSPEEIELVAPTRNSATSDVPPLPPPGASGSISASVSATASGSGSGSGLSSNTLTESSSRQDSSLSSNDNVNPNAASASALGSAERRVRAGAGGMSQSSSQGSRLSSSASHPSLSNLNTGAIGGGGGGGPGTKTPRKNVQWAASTKGEGPMNAAAEAHVFRHEFHRHRHTAHGHGRGHAQGRGQGPESGTRAGGASGSAERENESERHVHLLDEEGLDPKAFQTLADALERHQSNSHDISPSTASHSHHHPTVRRDLAASNATGSGSGDRNNSKNNNSDNMSRKPSSRSNSPGRPEAQTRRSEPPRLTWLPPNPFSPDSNTANERTNSSSYNNNNANYYNKNARDARDRESNNLSEIFTPTTLSPIHSDAETETDEYASPERAVPGEAFIESTETHGLPQPLPPSATGSTGVDDSGKSGSVRSRFSRFTFRSNSMSREEPSSSYPSGSLSGAGGRVGDGALGTFNALDTEEEERRRVERRATKLVRAHARGFQFLAGFKGNKALQRLAPEEIDPDAPLPRRRTRFSTSAEASRRSRSRRRPQSAPPSAADKSRESSVEGHSLFRFRGWGGRGSEEGAAVALDPDMEASAAYAPGKNAPLTLGSGVLSALLTLYDRSAGGTRSGSSTPGDRTPSGSEPTSPVENLGGHGNFGHVRRKEKEREEKGDYFGKHAFSGRDRSHSRETEDETESNTRKQMDELQRINTRLNAGSLFGSEEERERFEKEKESERKLESAGGSSGDLSPLIPPHPLYTQKSGARSVQSLKVKQSFSELTRTMSGGIERIKEKTSPTRLAAIPIPKLPMIGRDSRPSAARSGAGVFGSLIASTGNLTGIAAPEPSRIAPNPKRPGFHLSRYSISDDRTDPEAEEVLRRVRGKARSPGNSPRTSMAFSSSDLGHGLSSFGNRSGAIWPMSLGMSKSAPATPAGEGPPSLTVQGTPSPASDASPASETPLMFVSRYHLDSPATVLGGHSPSKSVDSALLLAERPLGAGHARAQSDSLSLTTIPTRGSAATSITLNGSSTPTKKKWGGILKDFQKYSSGDRSGAGSPDTMSEGGGLDTCDEKRRRAEEKRKRKRKKAEIFITRHVAEVMQRQEFLLKLTRAMMMFGAPSHRLPAQIQATARVLDIDLSCIYLPDVMLISFDDAATSTSNIKFIRQGAALSLGKLQDAYNLYWKVIHDEVGVGEASRALDVLMQQRPPYSTWQLAVFGGFCSASICQLSFSGSLIDSLIAFPLGVFLVIVQILSVRNELYSNVFEITISTLLSFMAAVFAGTHHFCYSAVASGSIVLILPGFLVLNGSLELSSRNIVSGAVRLCYAVMYALFLGFGLSIGGTLYETFTGKAVAAPEDYTCGTSHSENGAWYQRTPSGTWAFLTVPMFSLFLTLRNQAPWKRKELLVTVAISCVGWTCNHFSALKFPNRNDVSSAIGAFVVGFIANLYGRFFSGNAFVIMITGILFQLPSGLGNGGLITFASQNNTAGATTSYLSGFKTALQLISVAMGLTVGLGISLVVLFPIQSRKRAGGIFSL